MSPTGFGACPADVLLFLRSLDPVEDQAGDEVDRHAADCPRCRARLEALYVEAKTMRAEGAAGHVPAGVLARWAGGPSDLPASARRAIERHLERCDRCREELATLERIQAMADEFDSAGAVDRPEPVPIWGERATSESAAAYGRFLRTAGSAADQTVADGPAAAPSKRRRSTWLLGGYSALATAAAIVLALRGPLSTPPEAPRPTTSVTTPAPEPDPAPTTSPPAPVAEPAPAPTPVVVPPAPAAPSYQVTMLPKGEPLLTGTMRGAGDPATLRAIETDDGSGALIVRIEPTFRIPDDAIVLVELRTADGTRSLSRSRAPWRAFHGSARILLTRQGARLPAGEYVLRLTPQPGPGVPPEEMEPIDYRFEVGMAE